MLTETQKLRAGISRRSSIKAAVAIAGAAMLPRSARAAAAAAVGQPIVVTKAGKLQGSMANGVNIFRGIRYGADTGGKNRFLPPVPVAPWSGIQDASAFGHSAPQVAVPQPPIYSWYSSIQPISEDCLSLNVFTPALNDTGKRPVMVWLHGGSWANCAGSAPGFDGTNLAARGEVVVVTVNHRLNVFGYIQLEDKDPRFADSGNAGVLDMVLALQWVRDNAEAFGGDPNNVTLFGQSGGAGKIAALMDMPAAAGLFHKAIIESCSGGLSLTGREEAARQAHALQSKLGLADLSGATLQAVPMATLLAAMNTVSDPFRPVLDGRNFLRDPFKPGAPALSANIPILIGNAETETSYYLAPNPANFSVTTQQVQKRLSRLLKTDDAATAHIMQAYQDPMKQATPSDVLVAVSTDYVFRRNTTRIAALQSAQQKAVYAYVFTRRTPVLGGHLHTPHTSEVPFAFGTTVAAAPIIGSGPDVTALVPVVMDSWVNFARTGNPDNGNIPHWPQYETKGRHTLMLNQHSHVQSDPGGVARQALNEVPLYEYSVNRAVITHD